jgi:hypothetical protein
MMRRRLAALGLAATIAVSAAACSSDPKDPAQQREDRVRARVEATFSRSQATCIMEVLDASTISALDKVRAVAADSDAMRIYTNAVVACTA